MFLNNIFQRVFTSEPIKREDDQRLIILLIDGQSGLLVTSGPEASARVEIVVLEADFGNDSWTREVFKSRTVRKEGNISLLTKSVMVYLNKDIGAISQISVWMKKCEYRLGAIVSDYDMGTKIREGYTDSFIVKDGHLKCPW